MILQLKYFGMVAEATGRNEEEYDFSLITAEDLDGLLKEKYSQLEGLNYKYAANQSIVERDYVLCEKDEIALLPPFAGG